MFKAKITLTLCKAKHDEETLQADMVLQADTVLQHADKIIRTGFGLNNLAGKRLWIGSCGQGYAEKILQTVCYQLDLENIILRTKFCRHNVADRVLCSFH